MKTPKKSTWLERVEEVVRVLEGSTVGELEMTEGDTEIIIRRSPGMVMSAAPTSPGVALVAGAPATAPRRASTSTPVAAPLTGVFYASASPTTPAFVNVGDVVQIGQVVALIEAMKVFNEITAEVAGRVVSIDAKNGDVVQKDAALMHVEPL